MVVFSHEHADGHPASTGEPEALPSHPGPGFTCGRKRAGR